MNARGFFEELDNPSVGRSSTPGLAWRMRDTPNPLPRGPVTLGQANEYAYRKLLGMSANEYGGLRNRSVIGETSAPSVVGA